MDYVWNGEHRPSNPKQAATSGSTERTVERTLKKMGRPMKVNHKMLENPQIKNKRD